MAITRSCKYYYIYYRFSQSCFVTRSTWKNIWEGPLSSIAVFFSVDYLQMEVTYFSHQGVLSSSGTVSQQPYLARSLWRLHDMLYEQKDREIFISLRQWKQIKLLTCSAFAAAIIPSGLSWGFAPMVAPLLLLVLFPLVEFVLFTCCTFALVDSIALCPAEVKPCASLRDFESAPVGADVFWPV